MRKIDEDADFRIAFDARPALIVPAPIPSQPVMPADLQPSPVPLAEIAQGPNAFELFLDRNQKNLIILASVLAIAVAALVIYRGIEQSRQETAGQALIKAENLSALQALVQQHPDTMAASSAMTLLAERQWTENQQDAAIETLRQFIAKNPNHPALATAKASLGSKLMIRGKTADATQLFQELADDPKARYIAPFALISLGDIAKLAGDTEKAETFYKRVGTDFADSSFAATAKLRSASIKAKPPTPIDPPPAPKTETPAATAPATPAITPAAPATPATTPPAEVPAPPATPSAEVPAATPPQETKPESRSTPVESVPAAPKP